MEQERSSAFGRLLLEGYKTPSLVCTVNTYVYISVALWVQVVVISLLFPFPMVAELFGYSIPLSRAIIRAARNGGRFSRTDEGPDGRTDCEQ